MEAAQARIRRVDLSPDEWIAGTLGMTVEEEGLYVRIIVRMYSHGGAVPADPAALAHLCGIRPQMMRRLLPKLLPKFLETGGKLRQNRVETELKLARNRVETARLNGAKGGRPKDLEKPGGLTHGKANHHYHHSKEEGFSPKALNPVFLTNPTGSPPLPSRGDGGEPAGPTTTTKGRKGEQEPSSDALIDPAEKAAALAELHRALDAARAKAASLNGHAEADA